MKMKKFLMQQDMDMMELFKLREDSMRVARGEKPIWGELEFPARIEPDKADSQPEPQWKNRSLPWR